MIKAVKKQNDINNNFLNYLVTYEDNKLSYVPHNEENMDYQAILQWVADGNTIEEADD